MGHEGHAFYFISFFARIPRYLNFAVADPGFKSWSVEVMYQIIVVPVHGGEIEPQMCHLRRRILSVPNRTRCVLEASLRCGCS